MGESKPEPDKKRVTLRDVAEEAGVSLKTASNVINHSGRMTDSTREKVQKVIDRLGYRVNVSARNLNRGKTGFITLAVPTLTAPYLSELANRVIDAARGYGYSVYVTTYAEGSAQGAQSLLRNFNTTVSDGMILSISEVENLEAADLDVDYPLVCVGARSTHGKADHVTRRINLFPSTSIRLTFLKITELSSSLYTVARHIIIPPNKWHHLTTMLSKLFCRFLFQLFLNKCKRLNSLAR